MNKLNIVVVIFGITVVCVSCGSIFPKVGNGNLVASERTVSSFEKINVSGSAEVRFFINDEYRVVVTVDSNLVEYTEVYTRGKVLNIGTKSGAYYFTKYLVDVYCPVLTGISMSGSGQFSGNDTIITSTFNINISGSGEINGTIECNTFSAGISGSGKITVTGSGSDSDIHISGSGAFYGNEFSINKATVHISGSGKANINVSENLYANISGSGEINYRGEPKIESKISGSGRIKEM
jgi:hypothetical protein